VPFSAFLAFGGQDVRDGGRWRCASAFIVVTQSASSILARASAIAGASLPEVAGIEV
jgi:hypothetical protein